MRTFNGEAEGKHKQKIKPSITRIHPSLTLITLKRKHPARLTGAVRKSGPHPAREGQSEVHHADEGRKESPVKILRACPNRAPGDEARVAA
jgi:hypothetical protein